jgi:protein O-mannosyl-transferase
MKPRHFRYLLAIIVLVVFARACTNDFVGWDDNHTIYKNPAFNPPSLSAIMAFWSPKHPQAGLWIPVTYMVWGALAPIAHLDAPDASGSTLNPWIYHSANVVLHLATTLVVFELIRRMIRSDRAAFVGAILFAVHPIQVEPVCWASGLKDVLCGLLTISAAWQYLVFAETRQRKHFFIGMLLFILGMLSKPTAMVTPALAGALDLFITHRNWRLVARDLWPWFVLALPCLAWTKYFQPATGILTAPLWVRPLLVTDNLAFYLYKLIWPAQLSADYGHRPLLLMETGELYVTWPIPLAVAALLWRFRRKAPLLVLSAIIFVIGVLPVIGFTRFLFQYFSATADHYLYISMLGPALALAWVMTQPRASMRGARPYVIAILLIALSVRSFIQEGTWKDDLTLFNHTRTASWAIRTAPPPLTAWPPSPRRRKRRFSSSAPCRTSSDRSRSSRITPKATTVSRCSTSSAATLKSAAVKPLKLSRTSRPASCTLKPCSPPGISSRPSCAEMFTLPTSSSAKCSKRAATSPARNIATSTRWKIAMAIRSRCES